MVSGNIRRWSTFTLAIYINILGFFENVSSATSINRATEHKIYRPEFLFNRNYIRNDLNYAKKVYSNAVSF